MAKRQRKTANSRTGRAYSPKLSMKRLNPIKFQPSLLPRETYRSIVDLTLQECSLKMHDYFDQHGCMKCGSRTRRYGQNGMCRPCATKIGKRLRRHWKRRLKLLNQEPSEHALTHILANAEAAQNLLETSSFRRPNPRNRHDERLR